MFVWTVDFSLSISSCDACAEPDLKLSLEREGVVRGGGGGVGAMVIHSVGDPTGTVEGLVFFGGRPYSGGSVSSLRKCCFDKRAKTQSDATISIVLTKFVITTLSVIKCKPFAK